MVLPAPGHIVTYIVSTAPPHVFCVCFSFVVSFLVREVSTETVIKYWLLVVTLLGPWSGSSGYWVKMRGNPAVSNL